MSEIDRLGRRIGAVVLLLTAFWALPASAEVAKAEPGAAAVVESATTANEGLAALSDSDAIALAQKRKRKPSASVVRPQPARLAAVAQPGWNCTGSWCGRPFLLIIGISY